MRKIFPSRLVQKYIKSYQSILPAYQDQIITGSPTMAGKKSRETSSLLREYIACEVTSENDTADSPRLLVLGFQRKVSSPVARTSAVSASQTAYTAEAHRAEREKKEQNATAIIAGWVISFFVSSVAGHGCDSTPTHP